MSEAFIPPAAATPEPEITVQGFGTGTLAEIEHHIAQLKDELESARRDLAGYREREHRFNQPLADAIQEIVDHSLDRWVQSEGPLEVLGAIIESSVESSVEAALENATVEVDAYIRL